MDKWIEFHGGGGGGDFFFAFRMSNDRRLDVRNDRGRVDVVGVLLVERRRGVDDFAVVDRRHGDATG
jgi:hypothetical protein